MNKFNYDYENGQVNFSDPVDTLNVYDLIKLSCFYRTFSIYEYLKENATILNISTSHNNLLRLSIIIKKYIDECEDELELEAINYMII